MPVVVGVGHEVDVTIADLCADLRAPTPSAAAELVAPDHAHLRQSLQRDWARLRRAAQAEAVRRGDRLARAGDAISMLAPAQRIAGWRARLAGLARAVLRAGEVPLAQRAQLEALGRSLALGARGSLQQGRARLGEAAASLEALSPLAVLSRGYALVRRQRDGEIVRTAAQLAPGERVDVRVAEAELEAIVLSARPLKS